MNDSASNNWPFSKDEMATITTMVRDAHALSSQPSLGPTGGPAALINPTFNPTGIIPTEFKLLILPDAVEEKIGSIYVPVEKMEKDKYATTDGTIIAVSHLAFTYATEEEWDGHKPKPGDRIAYTKFAGARRKGKDGKDYLLINDKDVQALIED